MENLKKTDRENKSVKLNLNVYGLRTKTTCKNRNQIYIVYYYIYC